MKRILLQGDGAARVWIDEDPGHAFNPAETICREIPAGALVPAARRAAVEVKRHAGPRMTYAFLGVSFEAADSREDVGTVVIDVPWVPNSTGPETDLRRNEHEKVLSGLPEEYSVAVAEALENAAGGRLCAVRLRVCAAAHGVVGSSCVAMRQAAGASVGILLLKDPTDAQLREVIEEALRRR